jgi:putative transposase
MTRFARDPLYRRHRFPTEIIAHAVWLYFRFPLSLRMVEAILAARGIIVSHQTVRLWAEKFGGAFANDIRRRTAGRLGERIARRGNGPMGQDRPDMTSC